MAVWTNIPDKMEGSTIDEQNWDAHIKGNLEYLKDTLAALSGTSVVPPGAMVFFPGPELQLPAGYLLCYGQEVATTGIYASLYAVIGTLWGTAAVNKFRIPDMRGRVPVGNDATGGIAGNVNPGFTTTGVPFGGSSVHLLTIAQIPSHSHTGTTGSTDPAHNHGGLTNPGGAHDHGYITPGVWNITASLGGSTDVKRGDANARTDSHAGHQHTINTANIPHQHAITAEGGGVAHNNMQPFAVGNWIIKY